MATAEELLSKLPQKTASGTTTLSRVDELLARLPSKTETVQTQPTIVESLVNVLRRPSTTLPLVAPFGLTRQMGRVVGEAEKKAPMESFLPTTGAIVGGLVSAPTTPFGQTIGAGLGAAGGKGLEQIVRQFRGKEVSETVGGKVLEQGEEGLKASALQLGTSGILKGAEIVGAKKIAQKGLDKFTSFLKDKFQPKFDFKEFQNVLSKVENKPASNLTDTGELIDELFKSRGITYKPSNEAIRQQLMKEADLTTEETIDLVQKLADEKSGKLVSKLKTPEVKEYKKLADVLDDLSDPKLSYGELRQMRTSIGDLANFNSDKRTAVEKIYGSVYKRLGQDMERSAKEGNFLDIHKELDKEGRKVFQQKFLNDLFERSRDFTPEGEVLSHSKLATKLNRLTDDEIKTLFGEDEQMIKVLRDVSNLPVKVGGSILDDMAKAYYYYVPTTGLRAIYKRTKIVPGTKKILERRLGSESSNLKNIFLPKSEIYRRPIGASTQSLGALFRSNEENR